jgi:uncharacterized protein (TIGR03545 family)
MSTAGSDPNGDRVARVPIFRWRGISALAFALAVAAVVWALFGTFWIRRTLESTASQSLGTEVDIAALKLDVARASIVLRGIAIADPRDRTRNLVQATIARVALLPDALLEGKLVIRDFTLDGVRAGTRRDAPARPMQGGFAPRAMLELQRWRKQFDVPLLSLTPVDTVRSLVLDPAQLTTVKRARELTSRADSLRRTMTAAVQRVPLRETVDSAQALLARLKGQTPRMLGLTGTRRAVMDARRLTAQIDSIRRRIDVVYAAARAGADSIVNGARALDDARRTDYEFARSLLALPTVDAPNIGPALFGAVSIDAFEQAMYFVALAREYAPPGLLPRESPGPKRARRAGTTIHFVKQAVYPSFLLEKADVSISLSDAAGAARGDYRLTASDVTTEPAIVGRPARFSFDRTASGSAIETLAMTGTIDHVSDTPHEAIELRAGGVSLPSFSLPATPLRADLGRGRSSMRLEMRGDAINGSWTLTAPNVVWTRNSARSAALNPMEQLVTRVIQSVRDVDITASITGTMESPRLSVRSNLDRAVADGVKSVIGDEVSKAETRVRAQVDSLANHAAAPVRALAAQWQGEVDERARGAQTQLDDVKTRLATQLKALGIGILGLP